MDYTHIHARKQAHTHLYATSSWINGTNTYLECRNINNRRDVYEGGQQHKMGQKIGNILRGKKARGPKDAKTRPHEV